MRQAIDQVNTMPQRTDWILDTGDSTHVSKPDEFDTLAEVLKSEKKYLERFAKGSQGAGWFSFDKYGVHFIGLVNVANLKAGGLGALGDEQLQWLDNDLKGLTASLPEWDGAPATAARALTRLKRFFRHRPETDTSTGSCGQRKVTSASVPLRSTAFPQAAPGQAGSPGPMKVPADELGRCSASPT